MFERLDLHKAATRCGSHRVASESSHRVLGTLRQRIERACRVLSTGRVLARYLPGRENATNFERKGIEVYYESAVAQCVKCYVLSA